MRIIEQTIWRQTTNFLHKQNFIRKITTGLYLAPAIATYAYAMFLNVRTIEFIRGDVIKYDFRIFTYS